MIIKPRLHHFRAISFYLGRLVRDFSFLFLIPFVIAVLNKEWNPALDFVIAGSVSFIVGEIFLFVSVKGETNGHYTFIIVPILWIIAMFLGAIPLYLSGHFKSYLDACFDSMSGFATTGLTLIQDLDHLSYSTNFWRHFIMFIGGQGIIVAGILFIAVGSTGVVYQLYAGEGREEKIYPNVRQTAKFIWLVSFVYLLLGTGLLWIISVFEGIPILKGLFHSACVFMAAFDTGGFTPQSQSILYYHSFPYELVTMFLMFAGTLNFGLHYHLWLGNKKEIVKNIETVSLFLTMILICFFVSLGLNSVGAYQGISGFFRKGIYHVVSAHSGTGYMTVYAVQFVNQWKELALVAIMAAMGLGGCACSTAGGIKALRVGLIFKTVIYEIKRLLLPASAYLVEKYHHLEDITLRIATIRNVLIVTASYLMVYFLGSIAGILAGYPFLLSMFESISAAANVGLSTGITSADMPTFLKVVYILQMWLGRLEFISIFALIGILIALLRGK